MAEDRIEEQEEKEGVPEWAKNLTSAVGNLTDLLKEALQEPEQLEPETEQPQKVPVPPVPQEPEEQEPERPEILEVPEQEKPKKRKFLDWLL